MAHLKLPATDSIEHDHHSPLKIVVGGFSGTITSLEYDPRRNTFQNLSSASAESVGDSPSFIGLSPDGQCLFAVNEVANFRALNQTGSVSSFQILPDSSVLHLSSALTAAGPTALALSPNRTHLIVAEYTAGSWSRFTLDQDCRFGSEIATQTFRYHGSGPNKQRQDHSYIHQVTYNHAGDLVLFVDLGGDSVYVHRVDRAADGQVGELAHEIKLPAGSGPRHLSITGEEREYDIYLINELSNQIFTIRLTDGDDGLKSTIRQQLDTLLKSDTERSTFAAGEVMVSGDGRFVYGSNRQTDFAKPITDNSIVLFRRDLHTGLLLDHAPDSPVWFPLPVGGSTPRHFSFSLDPHQAFFVVGCQQANTLLIFRRHFSDGALEFLNSTFVQSPSIQLFIPENDSYIGTS